MNGDETRSRVKFHGDAKDGKEPSEEHEPMPGCSETYLGEVRDAFIDRLCGVPLLLHCRRAYLALVNEPEMEANGRRRPPATYGSSMCRSPIRTKKALQDVSIVFPRNTLTALFGASGVETILYE